MAETAYIDSSSNTQPLCVDAHHHLWKYSVLAYPWISDSMRVLQRDYLPPDLERELQKSHVAGSIAVQAQQTLEETHNLLQYAENYPFLLGVVGWAPLTREDFSSTLEVLSDKSKLKGLRHVIQDEQDQNFILREDFNRGIAELKKTNLVYDLLIHERHLPQTISLVDRHPEQVFVLDHIGKPRIAANMFLPWKKNILELAKRENVYCKLSGMVTEADWSTWNEASLHPYFEGVVEAFGPLRVMQGSDWPVCLLASSYSKWMQVVRQWIGILSPNEQARILGGTAIEAYRLQCPLSNQIQGLQI